MILTFSRFKAIGAAVVLAAGLGAFTLPAIAQDLPPPPADFSLGIPGNGEALPPDAAPDIGRTEFGSNHNPRPGNGFDQGYYPDQGYDDGRGFHYCLEDQDIVRGLRAQGFERVRIVRYLRGERVEATAYWGRNQYSLRIDRCSGIVDRVRLIRRSGFGLQFNFNG